MAMNQRDGVYSAVVAVVGEINGKVELTDSQKKAVRERIFAGFKAGEIEHAALPDDTTLAKYIPGLVNNWLRKDKRLNGGMKYVAKNPGIRAGAGDQALKAMKALLSATTDESAREEIQRHIDARQSELKPKKVVDFSALPPELQKYASVN